MASLDMSMLLMWLFLAPTMVHLMVVQTVSAMVVPMVTGALVVLLPMVAMVAVQRLLVVSGVDPLLIPGRATMTAHSTRTAATPKSNLPDEVTNGWRR